MPRNLLLVKLSTSAAGRRRGRVRRGHHGAHGLQPGVAVVAVRHLAVVVEGRRRRHGGRGRVPGSQRASGLLILH